MKTILVGRYNKCISVEILTGSLQPYYLSSFVVIAKSVSITLCRKKQLKYEFLLITLIIDLKIIIKLVSLERHGGMEFYNVKDFGKKKN